MVSSYSFFFLIKPFLYQVFTVLSCRGLNTQFYFLPAAPNTAASQIVFPLQTKISGACFPLGCTLTMYMQGVKPFKIFVFVFPFSINKNVATRYKMSLEIPVLVLRFCIYSFPHHSQARAWSRSLRADAIRQWLRPCSVTAVLLPFQHHQWLRERSTSVPLLQHPELKPSCCHPAQLGTSQCRAALPYALFHSCRRQRASAPQQVLAEAPFNRNHAHGHPTVSLLAHFFASLWCINSLA